MAVSGHSASGEVKVADTEPEACLWEACTDGQGCVDLCLQHDECGKHSISQARPFGFERLTAQMKCSKQLPCLITFDCPSAELH